MHASRALPRQEGFRVCQSPPDKMLKKQQEPGLGAPVAPSIHSHSQSLESTYHMPVIGPSSENLVSNLRDPVLRAVAETGEGQGGDRGRGKSRYFLRGATILDPLSGNMVMPWGE